MSKKALLDNILIQMQALLDGDLWYGTTISSKLAEISPVESAAPPASGTHNIQQILLHMDAMRSLLLRRLGGEKDAEIPIDSEADWIPAELCSPEKWLSVKDTFVTNYREMLRVLGNMDPNLMEASAGNFNYSFQFLIEGILHHDLYHLGQIAIVHSMLKRKNT